MEEDTGKPLVPQGPKGPMGPVTTLPAATGLLIIQNLDLAQVIDAARKHRAIMKIQNQAHLELKSELLISE